MAERAELGEKREAILAVEELSCVDASAGVIVDVQNTLVNNALLRWTTEEQKKRFLARIDDGEKNWKFAPGEWSLGSLLT